MTLSAASAFSEASVIPPHFTGKERDVESGNDYMFARYYNSNVGRFLSPDWSAKVSPVPYAKLDDPQSLNLYSYVYNSPLGKADPDGHLGLLPDIHPDIMVIEDGPVPGNPAGHTAIAITGKGVFSFGTGDKLGSSTTDFVEKESSRREQVLTIIKTTPAQDDAAAAALTKLDGKRMGIASDNCSSRSNVALDAARIPKTTTFLGNPVSPAFQGDTNLPGSAGARAANVPGSQSIYIPKDSKALPPALGQFDPKPKPDPKTTTTSTPGTQP